MVSPHFLDPLCYRHRRVVKFSGSPPTRVVGICHWRRCWFHLLFVSAASRRSQVVQGTIRGVQRSLRYSERRPKHDFIWVTRGLAVCRRKGTPFQLLQSLCGGVLLL